MSIKQTAREKNSNNNKQKIYDAALLLFDKYDFNTVTVDDICNYTNLSKGTFYHYFKSKEDLVIVAFIKALDKYMKEHYKLDEACSFAEQFTDFVLCMFDFAKSVGKDFTRRSYIAQISTEIELRIQGRVMVDILYKLIERGKRENLFKFDYSDIEFYTTIIGTFTGIMIKWSTDNTNIFDWEKFVRNQALAILI